MQSRNGTTRPSGAEARSPGRGRARQRAFMIAVQPLGCAGDGELGELRELLRTAGVAAVGKLIQRRAQPHPNTYLGPGKLEQLGVQAAAADANLIACDDGRRTASAERSRSGR